MSDTVTGFNPFYQCDSRVLILGSFPSVKSRLQNFYYGHPRNAFWQILAHFFGEDMPLSTDEKKGLLSRRKIALWDIVTECEIVGSQDATIKNYKVAELEKVLSKADIKFIFINGGKAYSIFKKHYSALPVESIRLPSTSPANARLNKEVWYDALRTAFNRP